MKKAICVLAMLMALLTILPSAGRAVAEADQTGSTAQVRALNDLGNYIYQSELMYSDVLWALEYFERYDAEKTWENLELARASLRIARKDIEMRGLADLEMTVEDQMELMRQGIDLSFMENLEFQFDSEKQNIQNSCALLHADIMENVLLQQDWAIAMQNVAVEKELMQCYIQYLANTADWVLATIGDDAVTAEFDRLLETYCPRTRACQAAVLPTPEEIETENNLLFDRMEELLLESADNVGACTDRRNALTERDASKDYAAFGAELVEISGMPTVIFYPDWFSDDNIFYFWMENGEVVDAPLPRTALERAPDGCRIDIDGVSKRDITNYLGMLEGAGLSCIGRSDEDGRLTALYQFAGSEFIFRWEEDSVSILMTQNPICFAPWWYMQALFEVNASD